MVYNMNHMHNNLLTKVEKHNYCNCDTQDVYNFKKEHCSYLVSLL